MLRIVALIVGLVIGFCVFLDAFQTLVLPRRPSGRWRITRLFFVLTWAPWSAAAQRIRDRAVREAEFAMSGPLSLLLLLVLWAVLRIVTFALIFFALGSPFQEPYGYLAGNALGRLLSDLYVSGTTLFTLGLGDVLPRGIVARILVIFEA